MLGIFRCSYKNIVGPCYYEGAYLLIKFDKNSTEAGAKNKGIFLTIFVEDHTENSSLANSVLKIFLEPTESPFLFSDRRKLILVLKRFLLSCKMTALNLVATD